MSTTTTPGTPGWLRARNDRVALALLLEHGPLTRNRIGELSGLSKPTAAQMVARLESAGLISVVGEASNGRGPNAALYGVRDDRMRGVAIDLGESIATSTIVDASGATHPTVAITLPAHDRSPETDVRGALFAAAEAAGIDPASVRIVCVGVQAATSDSGERLSFTDTLPGWPEVGARARIEAALGVDVLIDNDVNLAAVAERAVGATRDAGSFGLLWMGDGLGVSVDLGGTVHRGASGGAGEIGYLSVPREAATIAPDAGDLTDLIGGPAVATILRAHGATGGTLTELLVGLEDNEPALEELAPRIALGLLPVLAVLDPEVVVLGGPTGAAGGSTLAGLVERRVVSLSRWRPAVVSTGVVQHPVLAGARELLLGEIRTRLHGDVNSLVS
ncbi:MAG TPA: ROK family transcriptional regulator [Galbitalea sp.]|jgi:predicted NBD/HSP70 family sugar kinase|nr:ROK family transcriptional regulator [Galbitalea sp.]